MAELAPGARVAERYLIEAQIGSGGMGVVYRARDEKLARPVAIKVLSADAVGDAVARTRMLREARGAAALEHPAIVRVYDLGETDDGGAFLVMELVRGRSLRELLKERATRRDQVARVVGEVAHALAMAHRSGYVHRDVKPDNLMLRDDGRVAVLDFGLIKFSPVEGAAPRSATGSLTTEGGFVGTPGYVAPEQAEGREVDGRADQFSLGVVAYELLTGKLPWRGKTGLAMLAELLQWDPLPPSRYAPDIGPDVDAAIARAMAKRPGDRFDTIEAFSDALSRALAPPAAASTRGDERPDEAVRSGAVLCGRYRVGRPLRSTPFSDEYEGEDTARGDRVVLECLRPEIAATSRHRDRFERDVTLLRSLDHPNLAHPRALGRHRFASAETVFLVRDLVEGETLSQLLRERGSLSTEAAMPIVAQMSAALDAAHESGLVHGGFGPDHVIVSKDDEGARIIITGFGGAPDSTDESAQPHGPPSGPSVTYLAPEQVRGAPTSARSDIYALGTVAFELVTGRPPFTGGGPMSLAAKRLVETAPAPGSIVNGLDPRWNAAIVRCLDREPANRFERAGDFALALVGPLPALPPPLASEEAQTPEQGSQTDTPEGLQAPKPAKRRQRRQRWAQLAATLALGTAVVVTASRFVGSSLGPPTGRPRRLTSGPGWEAEPALSPNGDLVAYVSDEKGNPDIWLVDAGGGAPLRLTDDPAEERTPAWFPDGRTIAFASNRGGEWGIWKVPRLGGSATPLVASATDPAISPDGQQIAFARFNDKGQTTIWVAPLADVGQARALTTGRDGLWQHHRPAWSPDGTMIAYEDVSNIWTVSASGGKPQRLTSGSSDRRPVWSPDGRHLYFSGYQEKTQALWRVSTDDGATDRLTMGTGPEIQPSVSKDGNRLAYTTYSEQVSVLLVDSESGARANLFGTLGEVSAFALAPDGGAIAYVSNRQGWFNLWLQPLDGLAPRGEAQRLTDQSGMIASLAFSPDRRWIAFHQTLEGQRDIWLIPASGGHPVQITTAPAADIEPAWSPDGKTIAFISDRGGKSQVWLLPIDDGRAAGEPTQLTQESAETFAPTWSPDGSEIAYVVEGANGTEVKLISLRGASKPRTLASGETARFGSKGQVFVSGVFDGSSTTPGAPPRPLTLRKFGPGAGGPAPFSPEIDFGKSRRGDFDVSHDGRVIAIEYVENRGDLWVLDAIDKPTY